MATVFRPPVITRIHDKDRSRRGLRTFLAPTPLNLRGQDQFFDAMGMGPNYSMPNPRRRVWSPLLYQQIANLHNTLLKGMSDAPERQFVFAQGPLMRQYPVALRTHLQSLTLELLGQDLFVTGVGRGPVYAYPNPLRKGYPPSLRVFTQGARLPLETQVQTFFVQPLANPRLRQSAAYGLGHEDTENMTIRLTEPTIPVMVERRLFLGSVRDTGA